MKMEYEVPNIDIVLFEKDDIVLASGGDGNEREEWPFAEINRVSDPFVSRS